MSFYPYAARAKHTHASAFTLIELSIVLVIIGLIIGGVLAGRDLIAGAAVRAQISQIDQYNTASHAFQVKYGGLPGDWNSASAASFGFVPRGQYAGEGDGNGIIEGVYANATASNAGYCLNGGETVTFWSDLATANLISGSFAGTETTIASYYNSQVSSIVPTPKIRQVVGSAIYIFSRNGINYYGLGTINYINIGSFSYNVGSLLTVNEAYSIDAKIDDGNPVTGRVLADGGSDWAGGYPYPDSPIIPGYNVAAGPSSTTCFDNNNVQNGPLGGFKYSLSQNNGAGINCFLSFQFQ